MTAQIAKGNIICQIDIPIALEIIISLFFDNLNKHAKVPIIMIIGDTSFNVDGSLYADNLRSS